MSDPYIEEKQRAWLERHMKEADQLVFGVNSKICLAAVYFSPKEKMEQKPVRDIFRSFFQSIQGALTYHEDRE